MKWFPSRVFGAFALLLFSAGALHAQDGPDPRAMRFSTKIAPNEKSASGYAILDDTTYSIVIYGDRSNRHPSKGGPPSYRLHGLNREFSIGELTEILTAFYKNFPPKADFPVKGYGGPVPLPNIIYIFYSWNEANSDGHNLAKTLAKKHDVGMYYCQFNSSRPEIKEEGLEERAKGARDFYLELLNEAVKALKAPDAKSPKLK